MYTWVTFSLGVKRKRCGSCTGCTRADCGECAHCRDKPKFGGPGKRKQCCILKKCRFMSQPKCSPVPSDPKPSKLCRASDQPIPSIESFLANCGRKLHHTIGDGNCMFRTISYALLETEDCHYDIRSHIVRTVNLNQNLFSHHLMANNKSTISEQVHHMLCPSVWGTHLELRAAATLLDIPIYFCSKSPDDFSWHVFHPLPRNKITIPTIMDETFEQRAKLSYIEMYYSGNQQKLVDLVPCHQNLLAKKTHRPFILNDYLSSYSS